MDPMEPLHRNRPHNHRRRSRTHHPTHPRTKTTKSSFDRLRRPRHEKHATFQRALILRLPSLPHRLRGPPMVLPRAGHLRRQTLRRVS